MSFTRNLFVTRACSTSRSCFFSPSLSFSSSSSSIFWNLLQKNGNSPEKTPTAGGSNLCSSSIITVIKNCSTDQSLLAIKFFVWAGIQSGYRHSRYMYNTTCDLLKIDKNPHFISQILDSYRTDGSSMGIKAFKELLNLCREAKLPDTALFVLKSMRGFNCRPDTTAYNIVIKLFCDIGGMDLVKEINGEMVMLGIYPDMITCTLMTKGFCDLGRFEEAREVLDNMRGNGCSPNFILYSTLLDGVCRFGNTMKVFEILEEMERIGGRCGPNVVTYTSIIQSFCKRGELEQAFSVFDRMDSRGCVPNRVTIHTILECMCLERPVADGYKFIDKVIAKGGVPQSYCYSSFIVSLLKVHRVNEAEKLFRCMLNKDVMPDSLSCSLLIRELCLKGRAFEGFKLYVRTENLGCLLSIDCDVYHILLNELCKMNYFEEAIKLVKLITKKGVRLRCSNIPDVVEHLHLLGEKELVLRLTNVS